MQTNPEWSRAVRIYFWAGENTEEKKGVFVFLRGLTLAPLLCSVQEILGEHGPAVWVSCGFPLFIYTSFMQPQLEAAKN